jgi:uncharacterized damage-inducible protein DinB
MNAIQALLRGKGAHADPVACVEDLTAAQAGRRIEGFTHTIWQLLFHLNYWIDFELKCVERPDTPFPTDPEASWPLKDGPADDVAWRHDVALFRTYLGQLATLAEAKASTLARIAHAGTAFTVETVLILLIAHNSYHVGQIVQLRRAMGAWPPTDTG